MNISENSRPNEDELLEDKKRPEGSVESSGVVESIMDGSMTEIASALDVSQVATIGKLQVAIENTSRAAEMAKGNIQTINSLKDLHSVANAVNEVANMTNEIVSIAKGASKKTSHSFEAISGYVNVAIRSANEANQNAAIVSSTVGSIAESVSAHKNISLAKVGIVSDASHKVTNAANETIGAAVVLIKILLTDANNSSVADASISTEHTSEEVTSTESTPEAASVVEPIGQYAPAPVANTGKWAKTKSVASNVISVPREVATYPVAKHVVDAGGIVTSTGLGVAAGAWSWLPSWTVQAANAGGGLGQSIVSSSIIPTAIPVARHITGGVGAWRANRHFHTVINDNGLEKEIVEQLKKAHSAMEPKYTKQHMLLAQALAKVGPTPAETAKLVWEKNHSKECATNLIRIMKIFNAPEGDPLRIPGLTAKEVQEWQKRIGDLEPEEREALKGCKIEEGNMQKIIAEVATHNGKIVEEIHRKQHDKRMTPLVAASGVAGAATLTLAGVPLLMAGVPAVTSGMYLGSKYFYNRLNKRKNTILPHRKGITMASGAPLPPEETYDYKGTLYRKRVIEKTSADAAGNSKNVKEFADAIRNAFPPDLDDFAFFDTKHDLAKLLAPYAVQALTKVKEPAKDRDDGKVANLEDEVNTLKELYNAKQRTYTDIQQDLNRKEYEISNMENRNSEAAKAAKNYMSIHKDHRGSADRFSPVIQALIQKKEAVESIEVKLKEQLKEVTTASTELKAKERELRLERHPEPGKEFTPEKAISNEDAQKALAVVVDEKWKEWTEQTGIAGSFLRSLGIKVSQNQVMKEAGKATASSAATGAGLYALAASYNLPPVLGAVLGVYIGWKIYTSVLKTNS